MGRHGAIGDQLVCSFALFVIVSLTESDAHTSRVRFSSIEALIKLPETLLSLLSGLRIPAAAVVRPWPGIEILNQALSKLIQNLQKLNQLQSSNRKVT
jgi:hypothetical protein